MRPGVEPSGGIEPAKVSPPAADFGRQIHYAACCPLPTESSTNPQRLPEKLWSGGVGAEWHPRTIPFGGRAGGRVPFGRRQHAHQQKFLEGLRPRVPSG